MKKIFLLTITLSLLGCVANKNFNNDKVITLKKEYSKNYKIPRSIVFTFNGDTHLVNNFLTLEKYLKKDFYDSKIDFVYNLKSDKPFQADLDNIPQKEIDYTKFQVKCDLLLPNESFSSTKKGWYSYTIELKLINLTSKNLLLASTHRVIARKNITTNNEEVSRSIFNIISNY